MSNIPLLHFEGISANHSVARDAYGFSLHYFDGDYTSSGGINSFVASQASSNMSNASYSKDLYNGNIARMVTTITHPNTRDVLSLGNGYQYDQLNRLLESASFNDISFAYNSWSSAPGTGMYANRFAYDANGNILHQSRSDEAAATIDEMDYYYPLDVNGKTIRNRLLYVDDQVDDSEDINPGMSTTNYQYDAEGRLIATRRKALMPLSGM